MDLSKLLHNDLENIFKIKENFHKEKDPLIKQKLFESVCSHLEDLNKIRKIETNSADLKTRLKELILKLGKEAKEMKEELKLESDNRNPDRDTGKKSRETSQSKKQNEKSNKSKEKLEFEESLKTAIITEKPNVKWEDVAGLQNAKQTLKEAIVFPTKFPEVFVGLRKPWKGILLYGVLL